MRTTDIAATLVAAAGLAAGQSLNLDGKSGISGVFTIENQHWKGNLAFNPNIGHDSFGQNDVLPAGSLLEWNQL